ncbi:MAG: hypothetical protein IJ679_07030 [Lachnospiraceae bacterium]|nr:hypothetical protein [Lachnospiraceae bacterium]
MYNVIRGLAMSPADASKQQIIDSNERMSQIVEARKRELERQAEERRRQLVEDYLETLEPDEEGKPILPVDEEGNVLLPVDEDGTPLLYVHSDGFLYEEEEEFEEEPEEVEEEEEPPINREEILAEIQKESDEILANANAEAEKILAEAGENAEQIRGEAEQALAEAQEVKGRAEEEGRAAGHAEGYQAGYEEGGAKALEEYEAKSNALKESYAEREADFAAKSAEFDAEVRRLKAEYKQKESNFERQMGDLFCDIIDKVFHIEFSDKEEIILHLVDNVISNTPSSKEYMVRVNDHNYDLLNENKAMLIEKVGSGIGIDIIKDPLLGDEECQIETDGGVYDCGMDVQLENLLKDLRALSLV